jgi:serine/threonine-protein kinase
MTAGAPEIFPEPPPQVPGVDINKPIDDEDDPTIEWDRFNLEELGGAGMSQGAGEEKEPVVAAPPPSVDKARPSLEGPRSVPAVRYTSQPPSIVPAPASSGSSAGLVLALLFFIFALVLGGIMAAIYAPQFAAAKKADLKFKISGAESVEIVIDGDKVHSGPLEQGYVLLEDFEAGRREITIRAEGREAVSDSLLVQGGKSYEIPVELRKEAATKAVTVGIKVKVEPGDAQVLLDDKPLDAAKPLVATGLKPGKHKLVFRKEGFVEQVQEFTLEEGTRDFEVTLKPARITLEITAEPVGAKVSLHALDGGKRALVKKGKAPFAVKDLDATRKYEIKVSRDGFADWIKPFEPGLKATETFAVKLEAKTEPVALVGEKKPVVDKEAERKRLEMAEKRRAEKERRELLAEKTKPEVRERPEQAKGSGFVAIISKPPARVILNGRDIGYTPKLKVSLPAGKHRAVLKMESIKVTKSYSFTIKPNSTHIIKGRP